MLCGNCGRPRNGGVRECTCIPPWVWDDHEMVEAVRERDAQTVVRFLWQRVPGLSQEALGRMCGVSQPTINRAVAGHGLTDRRRAHQALEGMGAPLGPQTTGQVAGSVSGTRTPSAADLFSESSHDVVRQAELLWNADLARRVPESWLMTPDDRMSTPLLRWLVAPPAIIESSPEDRLHVTEDDVRAINRACELFESLDHEFGGGHARTAAVQYLSSEVAPLLRGRFTPQIGRALFAASSRFAAKTGAMAYDAGLHSLGRRYFLQSLNLAHLGSNRLLGAKALALLSHQANFLGHYRSAVDLARTAKAGTEGQATPAVQAMLAAMEARGLASLGEARACTKALKEMEDAFSRVNPEHEPSWMSYFDSSELADELAHCFHDLDRGGLAIEHAQQSVRLAPPGFKRSRTFAGLIHAGAHLLADGRDLEAACSVAEQTIANASSLRSARVQGYIQSFQDRLEPYAVSRPVQEFRMFLAASPVMQN